MPGSHWVCMYLDIRTAGIYFIDSVGKKPVYHIQKLIKRLIKQCNHLILNKKINFFNIKSYHQIVVPIEIINNHKIRIEAPKTVLKRIKGGMIMNFTHWNSTKKTYRKCNKHTHAIIIKKIDDNIITTKHPIHVDYMKSFHFNIGIVRGFRSFYNDNVHQLNNTECGIYCIYFITELLKNIPFYKLVNNIKQDHVIQKLRNVFYRPSIHN